MLLDLKKNKNAQIAAKKIVQKHKKLAKKKAPVPFNTSDVADAETIDYNKDTNINDVLLSKSEQIAAEKIINRYDNLRRKSKCTIGRSELDVVAISSNSRDKSVQIAAKKFFRKMQKNITRKDCFLFQYKLMLKYRYS